MGYIQSMHEEMSREELLNEIENYRIAFIEEYDSKRAIEVEIRKLYQNYEALLVLLDLHNKTHPISYDMEESMERETRRKLYVQIIEQLKEII